jgi:hypothetical protein
MFADNPSLQKLVSQVEADYMRDKSLQELDEMLLYAMDEKGHADPSVGPRPGRAVAGRYGSVRGAGPVGGVGAIERDADMSVDEKREQIQALERNTRRRARRSTRSISC